jgi:NADPH:quinone reductase-like Zn-dependent oxidoreductase
VIVSDEEDIVERVMEITAGQGARVVFDPVGGRSFEPSRRAWPEVAFCWYTVHSAPEPTPFPLFTVLGKSLTLKGYLYAEIVADPEVLERAKAFILQGLESGALSPIIAKTFPE